MININLQKDIRKRCSNPECKNFSRDKDGYLPAITKYFNKCRGFKYNLYSRCKICKAIQNKKSYITHHNTRLAHMKIYREINHKQVKISKKNSYLKKQEYYCEKSRKQRLKNPEQIRKIKKIYETKQRKENLEFRIRSNLRKRIRSALKRDVTYQKNCPTKELIGCPISELKKYLEGQFKPGMSWKNYGEWQIDHIIPCASFNLTNTNEQKKCFNYKNLQPLWKIENLVKGDRVI